MKLCRVDCGKVNRRMLDVQKVYDTVWLDVGYGVRGKLWGVIRRMYDISRSAVVRRREVGSL